MAKSKRDSEAAYRARKQLALQRKQEARRRQRTNRIVAVVIAVLLVVLAAVLVPALRKRRGDSAAEKQAAAAAAKPVADFGVKAADAGCAAEVSEPTPEAWTKHVPTKVDYPVAPPDGGPHHQVTLSMGADHFYAASEHPAPERAVHDLEHGLVVAWYDTELSAAEVGALKQVAAAAGSKKLRFVAVPWDRGAFADGRHVVLTAWGVTQRCARVSGAAIDSFVARHADAPGLRERKVGV